MEVSGQLHATDICNFGGRVSAYWTGEYVGPRFGVVTIVADGIIPVSFGK